MTLAKRIERLEAKAPPSVAPEIVLLHPTTPETATHAGATFTRTDREASEAFEARVKKEIGATNVFWVKFVTPEDKTN